MDQFFSGIVESAIDLWRTATVFNYLQLALAVVVLGWYMRRHASD